MTLEERATAEPGHVLLTGATGFLGSFLLAELLETTRARIYCLVRCRDVEDGRARLATGLAAAHFPELVNSPRIVPVPGDLSKPLLALTDGQFNRLARTVETIYHCGALVNFLYPYSALKPTNVTGTQEILRLASKPDHKVLHYISTLRVFGSFGGSEPEIIEEDASLEHDRRIYTGYSQSKWVAEKLVRIALARGLPVCIYRPGMVTGDSETGVSNLTDVMCRMIKSCIQLGSAPALDVMVDITPVDFVSRAIGYLSRQAESLGKTFHLVTRHPVRWDTLAEWLRSFGYPLRQVSYPDWRTELVDVVQRAPDNAMSPLVLSFLQEIPSRDMRQFGCRNTLEGLATSSITCPAAERELLSTYMSYFIRTGFVGRPQAGDALAVEKSEGRGDVKVRHPDA